MKAYFDNGATTMVDPRVVKAMLPYFTESFGNPSSLHSYGVKAREAVDESRKIIANKLGAKPGEIIFTSGGTESDNLAIKGVSKGHVITSKIEHPAVLRACETLEKVTYLGVDPDGLVKPDDLKRAIRDDTVLVSIMHANNEVGTVQPIREIYEICKKHAILFHTDAVQSFTKEPLCVKDADLISLSSHKIHGPKGVGALYVREGVKLKSLFNGGSHELGLRPGTENVSGIVGFARAVELSKPPSKALRDYIIKKLLEVPGSRLNGHPTNRLCNNINVSFDKVEGESVLLRLDAKGIAVSTGSACSSKSLKPSHVLTAMGLRPEQSHGAVRITTSKYSTKVEADYLIKNLKQVIKNLREMSPL